MIEMDFQKFRTEQKTRQKNGGSALEVMRRDGGYRINLDGSISFFNEVQQEREAGLTTMEIK